MMNITERLFALKDDKYGDFQSKLTPNLKREAFIGIRVPVLRKFAKELYKNEAAEVDLFLNTLPHKYFDENMLHALLLSEMKDFNSCMERVEAFLPYIDNWAVCDIPNPKVFAKNNEELLKKIKEWISSPHTYTCRFGIGVLMSGYLDEDFKEEYLKLPAQVHSDEYYVNMMIAWFFATALAKQWQATIPYIENNILDIWVHNKTIQKAIESYRITDSQKDYLRSLKIKNK